MPTGHPYVFFGRNICLGLIPIFQSDLLFCYSVVGALCIFCIVSSCQSPCLQRFSPSPQIVFSFLKNDFPCLSKTCKLDFFFFFLLLFLLPWNTNLRKYWYDLCQENVMPMFSSVVLVLCLKSLSHFKFLFVPSVRVCSDFIDICAVVQLFQHNLLKKQSFPH